MKTSRLWVPVGLVTVALAGVATTLFSSPAAQISPGGSRRESAYTVVRRDFVRSLRLSGTVEAVQATTITAPRISGPSSSSLIITRLVKAGTTVNTGDPLVEFDRQAQLSNALDRRAELNDLEHQIRKREAEEGAARARDDSELKQGESAVTRAELEVAKNEMLTKIQAEKNKQGLEQANARLEQLRKTYDL